MQHGTLELPSSLSIFCSLTTTDSRSVQGTKSLEGIQDIGDNTDRQDPIMMKKIMRNVARSISSKPLLDENGDADYGRGNCHNPRNHISHHLFKARTVSRLMREYANEVLFELPMEDKYRHCKKVDDPGQHCVSSLIC